MEIYIFIIHLIGVNFDILPDVISNPSGIEKNRVSKKMARDETSPSAS